MVSVTGKILSNGFILLRGFFDKNFGMPGKRVGQLASKRGKFRLPPWLAIIGHISAVESRNFR